MITSVRRSILSAMILASFLAGGISLAAEQKVVTNPLAKSGSAEDALKDFERVQKINNDLAIRHFTAQIAKNPKNGEFYARRGKAYSGNKDYDKALPDYDKAISLNPKLADAYVGRAVIRLMKKDYDKCWEDVHKAESLGAKFWPAFMESLKSGSKRDK